ncbi:MAG: proline iminopeptidase-family hydrolase [Thermomicrobiales bacterium]|nr:proline iminopeptidase-family hydrolase [Thermomicrobiales bacterium]
MQNERATGREPVNAEAIPRDEGFVSVPGGRVWYERMGRGPQALLLLHGGPGGNSEDLRPLLELAARDFLVVRYDQLGSWRSDQPDDRALWQVPRFVAEVEQVRQSLGLGQMHLLGHSWGSFLALEYALHHQQHLRSLTLASGAASTVECVAGMNRWRSDLPVETQATLARYEAAGDYAHPNYVAAIDILYRRHLCRVWPFPEPLATALAHMALPVYTTMWGPNEFTCTGSLLTWDRTARLGEIRVPTLITVGEFDEVHPACAETMHQGIPGSQLTVFAGAGHCVQVEQLETYWAVVRRFLLQVETTSSSA